MSYKNDKIGEAEFFLNKLHEAIEHDNLREVKYYLSAFLSASRSILQHTLKEVIHKSPSKQEWYDKKARSFIIQFFKNLRDNNIHRESVSCSKDITVYVGTIEIDKNTSKDSHIKPQYGDKIRYYIEEWPDHSDLIMISSSYMTEIMDIVRDGVAEGYIT